MNPLIPFYEGSAPDYRGRLLADILARDDEWLESTHDFIQWLFPLAERSGAVPGAPLADATVVAAFAASPLLRDRLRGSLDRMLGFYGLAREGEAVVKGANWAARAGNWFVRPTHNNLRLTRILKSLQLLALPAEARALRACLLALAREPGCGVGALAADYWRVALTD